MHGHLQGTINKWYALEWCLKHLIQLSCPLSCRMCGGLLCAASAGFRWHQTPPWANMLVVCRGAACGPGGAAAGPGGGGAGAGARQPHRPNARHVGAPLCGARPSQLPPCSVRPCPYSVSVEERPCRTAREESVRLRAVRAPLEACVSYQASAGPVPMCDPLERGAHGCR